MNESDCINPTCDCFENNTVSPSYCPSRDNCELYDIKKDHARLEAMFWSFVEVHQGETFQTARQLPFTYQVNDDNGREMVTVSRAKNPYTKNAVLNDLNRNEDYYGKPYIEPLADRFFGELKLSVE